MESKVIKVVMGQKSIDGAGVHLTRVLGHDTIWDFDPFLMLDSFDSRNSQDYIKGFPFHPHRGIETITYLVEGEMIHRDSLGNEGIIGSGGAQWMNAGSGILHEEMPQVSPRMLGIQLWLNLPEKEKMSDPSYRDISAKDISVVPTTFGQIAVVSGEYQGVRGLPTHHLSASFFDVLMESGKEAVLPLISSNTSFVFLLEGDGIIHETIYKEKSALLLGDGDFLKISATQKPLRLFLIQAPALKEGIAWGGSIVMNDQKDLRVAFEELRTGSFIKHKVSM